MQLKRENADELEIETKFGSINQLPFFLYSLFPEGNASQPEEKDIVKHTQKGHLCTCQMNYQASASCPCQIQAYQKSYLTDNELNPPISQPVRNLFTGNNLQFSTQKSFYLSSAEENYVYQKAFREPGEAINFHTSFPELFSGQKNSYFLNATSSVQVATASHRTSCNFHKMLRKMRIIYGIILFISSVLQLLKSTILHQQIFYPTEIAGKILRVRRARQSVITQD